MKHKFTFYVFIFFAVCFWFFYGFFNINSDDSPTNAANFNFLDQPSTVRNNNGPNSDLVGSWAFGAPVLKGRYEGTGAFWQNATTGYLFFVGGDTSGSAGISPYTDRYNVQTNTWSRMANIPTPVWYNAAVILRDSLYLIGGMTGLNFNTTSNIIQKYDINANTWTTRAIMPVPTAWNRLIAYQDSLIYSLGGLANGTSTAMASVYLYNARSNTWRNASSMPVPNCGFACAIFGDTIIVVCGGTGYVTGTTNNVYRGIISQTDRSQITWITGTSYPGTSRQRFNAAPWGCKGIIVGPGSASGFSTSTECYTFAGNTWTQQPSCLNPTSGASYGSFQFGPVGKFVVASGLVLSPPYSILLTQVYTDSVCLPLQIPLCEGFTNNIFPPLGWSVIYAGALYWGRSTVSGYGLGLGSARYNMWAAPSGTIQEMVTTTFLPSQTGDLVAFDYAYAPYPTSPPYYQDSLIILTSTNAGTSYNVLTRLGPVELQTAAAQNNEFTPSSGQWGRNSYTIPQNTNKIMFRGKSAFGNNLYLDSICVVHPVGIQSNNNGIPKVYSLSQNYPNPFNPTTIIKYAVPKTGNVEIKVFDLLGKEISILVNEVKQPGNYIIEFNASNLASGIYFYKIISGSFTDTKKMLLIK